MEDRKVVILHNFTRDEVAKLYSFLKQEDFGDPIVAVTTEISLTWVLKDLINELILEDNEMRKDESNV
ncbi:MAG: DUF3783 domain-containing protein [Thermoplasmata archaeon]|jgi:hypothetical protein